MTDIKGPAIDPETFRVEGHCCGIRIPALQTMDDVGLQWELTAEAKTQLVDEGIMPTESRRDEPKPK
jgi:hypothetical protein